MPLGGHHRALADRDRPHTGPETTALPSLRPAWQSVRLETGTPFAPHWTARAPVLLRWPDRLWQLSQHAKRSLVATSDPCRSGQVILPVDVRLSLKIPA